MSNRVYCAICVSLTTAAITIHKGRRIKLDDIRYCPECGVISTDIAIDSKEVNERGF